MTAKQTCLKNSTERNGRNRAHHRCWCARIANDTQRHLHGGQQFIEHAY